MAVAPPTAGRRQKATVRAIAAELGRSPSTISREIRRKRPVGARGQWHYRPHAAHARANALDGVCVFSPF
nr:helix-turn-helix domain-containing protein [Streptomyces yokosukanensis]